MTAATIAGPTMKFDIVAVNRGFTSAVADAEQQWKAATRGMTDETGGLNSRLGDLMSSLMPVFQSAADSLATAFTGGANAAEAEAVKAFDAVKEGAQALLTSGLGSLGEKLFGSLGRKIGETLGGVAKSAIDTAAETAVATVSTAFTSNEWLAKFSADMEATRAQFAATEGAASDVAKQIGNMIEGLRQAGLVIQGLAMSGSTFDGMIGALDKVIQKHERNIELIGKTVAEQAKLKAQWQTEDVEGIDQISDDQRAKLDKKIDAVGQAAAQEQAAKSAQEQAKAYASMTLQFDRQLELAEARRTEEGLTAGQLAEERMIRDGIAKMQQRGRDLSAEELDILVDQAHQLRIITEENTRAAFVKNSERNADRALMGSFAQRRELGANAGEIAEMRYLNAEFQRAREANIALSAEMIARMEQNARSVGMVTQATAELRERFQQIQAAGQTVSRSLEDAFGQFMSGTQIKWREWVADLIAEMAKLTLRTQVLQPLFGGGAGNPAGLIGSMLQGMFGGARADGGPVTSGRSYLVGERGPELFVPQSAGTILPQVPQASQAMQQITIAPQIDARGATPDAVAALEARIPGIMLETWADARERGALA